MDINREKLAAAEYAAGLVQAGMIVGLGTGTTAELAIRALGRRVAEGLQFVGVPSSAGTATLARSLGIPLRRLDNAAELDLGIDGADEVDARLSLIKGGGGALLREKLVAAAARRFVVVVDESKLVQRLGDRARLPVEVVAFGWTTTLQRLTALGLSCELRRTGGRAYLTNNHNYILDCRAPARMELADQRAARTIKETLGVVEHGLFLDMADLVVVGTVDGVRLLSPS